MANRDGKFSQRSLDYVATVEQELDGMSPRMIADRINAVVRDHDEWRARRCMNLNAADNALSRRARALLASDLATRVTEGFPGDKEFPAREQNVHIDEIEAILLGLVRRRFHAAFADWRAVSTTMANASVIFALTQPGDVILVQPEDGGGNYSYNPVAVPRLAHVDARPLPMSGPCFEVEREAITAAVRAASPRLIIVGGSNVLFPYPVRELRQAADEVQAVLVYDAAHVGLLISEGLFQDPFAEGAHVITMSTHKVMAGAVGGLVLTNDPVIAQKILGLTFPAFLQTRDQNKYAATAHALAEMAAFGNAYARQMVANARALGGALAAAGFGVLAADRGFTDTHQVFVFIPPDRVASLESRCQASGLLVTTAQRMHRDRVAVRLTTQEITRIGMGEADMVAVAGFLRRAIIDHESTEVISLDVTRFLAAFADICYSFDGPCAEDAQSISSDVAR
jgi:glycine hydroxymethyltransferase